MFLSFRINRLRRKMHEANRMLQGAKAKQAELRALFDRASKVGEHVLNEFIIATNDAARYQADVEFYKDEIERLDQIRRMRD